MGQVQFSGPCYVFETMPGQLMGVFGPMINIQLNIGVMLGTLMGLIIPSDSTEEGYLDSQSWRFVFGFPLIL